jgi:hypothetical protein
MLDLNGDFFIRNAYNKCPYQLLEEKLKCSDANKVEYCHEIKTKLQNKFTFVGLEKFVRPPDIDDLLTTEKLSVENENEKKKFERNSLFCPIRKKVRRETKKKKRGYFDSKT